MTDDQSRRDERQTDEGDLPADVKPARVVEQRTVGGRDAPAQGRAASQATRAAGDPRESGYRGSLSPREDRLARPWVIAVIAVFLLILLLSAFGLPSRLIPEPTPVPLPSFSLPAAPSASVPAAPQ